MTEAQVAHFMRSVPPGDRLVQFLKTQDSRVSSAELRERPVAGDADVWVLRVQPSTRLQQRFGLDGKLAAFAYLTRDLKVGDLDHLHGLLCDHRIDCLHEIAVLVTDDDRSSQKLRQWAYDRTDGLTFIPVTRSEIDRTLPSKAAAGGLVGLLESWLEERDLYQQFGPVSGEAFFGRRDMLRRLEEAVLAGQAVGLFGLRKIGKTSLMRELENRLKRKSYVMPIHVDLQTAPTTVDVIHRVATAVAERFALEQEISSDRARRTLRLPEEPEDMDPERYATRLGEVLRNLLTGGAFADMHVVLLLDEIELLFERESDASLARLAFLRSLRGVAQETRKLSIVVAGVNATPCESATLDGRDNPVYGFLKIQYVGPLETAGCRMMIQTVGERMGLKWTTGPMDILIDHVGAHPLLARLAASDVSRLQKSRPFRPTRDQARSVLGDFHRKHAQHFRQIVDSLKRHYPDELDVLSAAAEGDKAFVRDWCAENPEAINHLVGYGVMDYDDLTIRIPALASWLEMGRA